MEIRVHKFLQQGQEMYATVLSGKTIAAVSDVDSVDKYERGYQRPREKARCENIREYIEEVEGLVPGAILLNVRPENKDELHYSKLGEQDGVEFGTMQLPEGKFAWQIDGQHRVGAFELLQSDMLVPVVVLFGLTRRKEAELFNVVNSKQKNVSASLRYYDLMEFAEERVKRWSEKGEKESEELAYNLVVELSKEPLWEGRINLTGVRGMKRAINLKGFMDALRPVVKDRWYATLPHERQKDLLLTFWKAMAKTWPTALGPDATSLLTKTFGAHVAGGIAIDVFLYCAQLNDFTEKTMATLLEPTKETVDNWDPNGALRAYAGGGRKSVGIATDVLRAQIRARFEELAKKSKQPA
jgi:DGQHR domain-containing protein